MPNNTPERIEVTFIHGCVATSRLKYRIPGKQGTYSQVMYAGINMATGSFAWIDLQHVSVPAILFGCLPVMAAGKRRHY